MPARCRKESVLTLWLSHHAQAKQAEANLRARFRHSQEKPVVVPDALASKAVLRLYHKVGYQQSPEAAYQARYALHVLNDRGRVDVVYYAAKERHTHIYLQFKVSRMLCQRHV